MKLKFLKPQAANLLITFIVLLLPLIKERAPSGFVSHYSPLFLLSAYLQMKEYYASFLMFGYLFVVYVGVSVVLALTSKFFMKKKK